MKHTLPKTRSEFLLTFFLSSLEKLKEEQNFKEDKWIIILEDIFKGNTSAEAVAKKLKLSTSYVNQMLKKAQRLLLISIHTQPKKKVSIEKIEELLMIPIKDLDLSDTAIKACTKHKIHRLSDVSRYEKALYIKRLRHISKKTYAELEDIVIQKGWALQEVIDLAKKTK